MRRRVLVILAVFLLLPRLVVSAEATGEVPFKLYRGYVIVVRGSIGNLKNLRFIIDTGAAPSVVDVEIARKLHLTGRRERVSVFNRSLDTERVVVPNVDLGPLHADALPVVVRDLGFAEEALGTRVDAMIGFDFLRKSSFTIDYKAKKLVFGRVDSSMFVIPYQAGADYVVVEMRIQQQRVMLLVDTGASGLVLFEGAARVPPGSFSDAGTRVWSNMGGAVQVRRVRLLDAYLGPVPWGPREAFILKDVGANSPAGVHGLLGVASLKLRRLGFDSRRQILALDQ